VKISELNKILEQAKEKYGDIKVEVLSGANMFGVRFGEVNEVKIVATGEEEQIDVGEELDVKFNLKLRLSRVADNENADDNVVDKKWILIN